MIQAEFQLSNLLIIDTFLIENHNNIFDYLQTNELVKTSLLPTSSVPQQNPVKWFERGIPVGSEFIANIWVPIPVAWLPDNLSEGHLVITDLTKYYVIVSHWDFRVLEV